MNFQRKYGPFYIILEADVCFTESKARRFHRHFYHASEKWLMSAIKHAKPEKGNVSTRSTISEVTDSCDICQLHARVLQTLRVSLQEKNDVID